MIITKKKHLEIVEKKDKEIDFLADAKRKLENLFADVYTTVKSWENNKMGNKKAITTIAEIFKNEN